MRTSRSFRRSRCRVLLTALLALPSTTVFAAPETPPAKEIAVSDDSVARTSILILPFVPARVEQGSTWIGKAISQTLRSDLSIDASMSVTLGTKGAAEADAALKAGKNADAQYVVFGSYQKLEDDVRITGGILNVENGKTVAGIKATGALRDLFALEDTLTHQVQLRLRRATKPGESEVASDAPAPSKTTKPTTEAARDDAEEVGDADLFADTRVQKSPTIGIRKAAVRDPDDWDNADLDRLAFSDAGRQARTRYFYENPYYASPAYFGGYGYSSYGYGIGYSGYGYGAGSGFYGGYGYSSNSVPLASNRYGGWSNGDTTAGYGNTAGGVRMTLRAPGAYGGSRALDGAGPVRQPVRDGGRGTNVSVRVGQSHRR